MQNLSFIKDCYSAWISNGSRGHGRCLKVKGTTWRGRRAGVSSRAHWQCLNGSWVPSTM